MSEVGFTVVGSGFEIGEMPLSVADLFDNSNRLIEKTGISTVWQTEVSTHDLAVRATSKAVAGIDIQGLKYVLFVTQSGDHWLPSHACKLQDSMNFPKNLLAFDVGQGCSGFVQALDVASRLLRDEESALIVTADRYRGKLRTGDRATSAVFSDGAAATLIRRDSNIRVRGVSHYTDGAGWCHLYQPVPTDAEADSSLVMEGHEVFLFTKRVIPQLIAESCSMAGVRPEDLDVIYAHQASALVLEALTKDERLSRSEIPQNLSKWGNTTSSTIPILLNERPLGSGGERLAMLIGFGVGLSASAMVLDVSGT